jgi:hypothetical protein
VRTNPHQGSVQTKTAVVAGRIQSQRWEGTGLVGVVSWIKKVPNRNHNTGMATMARYSKFVRIQSTQKSDETSSAVSNKAQHDVVIARVPISLAVAEPVARVRKVWPMVNARAEVARSRQS